MIVKEMKQWFGSLTLNTIVHMLFGIRFGSNDDDEEGIKTIKTLRKFFDSTGSFIVSDAIPFLRWLDLGGNERCMKNAAAEIDNLIQKWLEEHRSRRNNVDLKPKEEGDFMDAMISILDATSAEDHSHFGVDTTNKAIWLTLLLGGIDLTTVTMAWVLAVLLNNPQEIEESDGRARRARWNTKEGPRIRHDCIVAGHRVPKGTRLLLNLHKIQRNPNVRFTPNEFRPERILTSQGNIDVRGQYFELIPFGSGRRICPGMSFGLSVVHFTLASLLHSLEFVKPSDEPIDMTEGFGTSNLKATPLDVLISPLLSADLY